MNTVRSMFAGAALLALPAEAQEHRFEDDPVVMVRENFVACDVLSQLQRVMDNPRFLLSGECDPVRAGDRVRVYARRGPYVCIYPHDTVFLRGVPKMDEAPYAHPAGDPWGIPDFLLRETSGWRWRLEDGRGDGWPPRPSGGGTPTMASTPPLRARYGRTCAALGLYPRQNRPAQNNLGGAPGRGTLATSALT